MAFIPANSLNGGGPVLHPPPQQGPPRVGVGGGSGGGVGGGGGGGKRHRHDDEEQGKLFVGGLRLVCTILVLLSCLTLIFFVQLGLYARISFALLYTFRRGDRLRRDEEL
jgi:hypothetical protein